MTDNDNDNQTVDLKTKKKRYNGDIKIRCTCGAIIVKYNILNHKKTNKHKKHMELIEKGII